MSKQEHTPAELETLANRLEFQDRILSDEYQDLLRFATAWKESERQRAEAFALLRETLNYGVPRVNSRIRELFAKAEGE